MEGVLVVDKPEGWTSHDVVNRVRRLSNTKKVGHLGTLDPMATGVLPLLIGRATRLAQFFNRGAKTYEAAVRFGFSTDSYDRTGAATSEETPVDIDVALLEPLLDTFRGRFLQTPPPVSAKKIGGTPAYKFARKKLEVALEPVEVEVFELMLLEAAGSVARLRCSCSAGTYLRGIAHDLGLKLGCGAHLDALRRTAAGPFRIEQALTLMELEANLEDAIIPAADLLPEFPAVTLDELSSLHVRQGRNFPAPPFREQAGSRYVKAVFGDELVAIGEAVLPNLYHPVVVL